MRSERDREREYRRDRQNRRQREIEREIEREKEDSAMSVSKIFVSAIFSSESTTLPSECYLTITRTFELGHSIRAKAISG